HVHSLWFCRSQACGLAIDWQFLCRSTHAQYRAPVPASHRLAYPHTRGNRRSVTMEWETVIGLEVHVQLATQSKLFSGASTTFGAEPNSQACAIDLALPGTLPVLNEAAVKFAVMFGLAVNAEIAKRSVFERKNYSYPDLPKGYQTTQLETPIVGAGYEVGRASSRG